MKHPNAQLAVVASLQGRGNKDPRVT
jgi:hypothetical protein